MNIKALATAALAATSLAVAAPLAAEAGSCFNAPGGVICNSYEGTNSYGRVYCVGYCG